MRYLKSHVSKSNLADIRRFKSNQEDLQKKPDPNSILTDYVGPPHPISNIRPYIRHVPKDETPLERRLRQRQNEVEKWNHEFWLQHNKSFYEERKKFLNTFAPENPADVPADKMSEFYKSFLDKNKQSHLRYNYLWYSKNFELLKLSFMVQIQRLFKKKISKLE
ncbi:COA8 family protein CG14806, mitochondrial [Eurosta solidaginis]|uniref:COA8 family protein CG14806, mitochondrial n=1 Tax=Eurosta solidaginis TaxID=178769 RepID=UPI003530FF8A